MAPLVNPCMLRSDLYPWEESRIIRPKRKMQLHVCTKDLRLFNTSSHDEYYTIVVLFAVGGLMPHSFFSQP